MDFLDTTKPSTTGPTRIAQMRKRAFDSLAAQTLKTTASRAGRIAAVATIRGLTTRRLVLPTAICLSRGFGDVSSQM